MSSESTGSDILDQYRHISNKLKKRFLRKPNLTEACESFSALGKKCESLEMPSYAGVCWISTARCEGSLGNITGETSSLVRAARQFLTSEDKDYNLGCPSPSQENLEAALGCYAYASSRYPEDCPLKTGLSLEIFEFLKKIDRNEDAEAHLLTAIELSKDSLDTKIFCLELLAAHYIKVCNYSNALSTFNKIADILEQLPINGARTDTLLKCEINRLFLLLILKPTPQKLSPNLTKLLEKYTWGDQNEQASNACPMSEKMYILLQSLVATCQSSDTSNLDYLESELWELLENEERELLRILCKIYLEK